MLENSAEEDIWHRKEERNGMLENKEFDYWNSLPNIILVSNSYKINRAEHVARMLKK